jgi:hypothetical protein
MIYFFWNSDADVLLPFNVGERRMDKATCCSVTAAARHGAPSLLASSCMANEMLFRFRHCRNAKRRARAFDFCNNEPFQLLLFCCVCVFIFPTSR